jgi:lysophospholipase L1-like esterase
MKSLHRALFALLAALLATEVGAQPAQSWNPAVTPAPRNDWIERHNGFVARARDGGVDVLFIGDSITDAWRGTGKDVWMERYAPLRAANFGIGGDRTEHLLWRLQNGELDGIKPKVAVLMIGTNNTRRDTAAQITEGVTAIVKEIRQRTPQTKILLLAIFPRGEKPDDPLRQKINEINPVIAKLHDGQNVHFLDINAKFLQPDGVLPASIMPDFLHPNAEGYRIWGDAMAPKLAELLK